VSVNAAGVANNPQTTTVALTVNAAAPTVQVLSVVTRSALRGDAPVGLDHTPPSWDVNSAYMKLLKHSQTASSLFGIAALGLAIGATAVGAVAIGAVAIGRIKMGQGRVEKLSIGTLTVDTLIIRDGTTPFSDRA
jgi:hypothetical protein